MATESIIAVGAAIVSLIVAPLISLYISKQKNSMHEKTDIRKELRAEIDILRNALKEVRKELDQTKIDYFTLKEENLSMRNENMVLRQENVSLKKHITKIEERIREKR